MKSTGRAGSSGRDSHCCLATRSCSVSKSQIARTNTDGRPTYNQDMQDAVIVSAVRTPTGKFLGGLRSFSATELGALVVREAVARAGVDPASVEECIMGNVVSAGLGQAPARQAALRGGLGDHVAALTINKVCGSGLEAVMLAAQGIATGDIEIAVAGGMESMSNAPYLLQGARDGP